MTTFTENHRTAAFKALDRLINNNNNTPIQVYYATEYEIELHIFKKTEGGLYEEVGSIQIFEDKNGDLEYTLWKSGEYDSDGEEIREPKELYVGPIDKEFAKGWVVEAKYLEKEQDEQARKDEIDNLI